jgi:hypothetical protein
VTQSSLAISRVEVVVAASYILEHIGDSQLIQTLGFGLLTSQCRAAHIVAARGPVPGSKWDSGIGGDAGPVREWLIQESISYLARDAERAVLFVDLVSSPSDPKPAHRDRPPFWHHRGEVFWPVVAASSRHCDVARAMAWNAGFRQMAWFSRIPLPLVPIAETVALSESEFSLMVSSVERIITDVFDGEGYLDWMRE